MLRSLKEVQADDSIVGFYQAMSLGSFYNQSLVDTQAIQQEKLRHGGIVLVHGTLSFTLVSFSEIDDIIPQTYHAQLAEMLPSAPSD